MSCSLTCLNDLLCTTNLWLTPIQLPSVSQVSPGRSIDGKGGDISLHRLALMPKQHRKKCEGIRKEVQKSEYAWREKGTFQFQLHKSWAWQQISHSQSTCPDRHWTACNISAHVFCLPTLPTLLSTWAVWLFVYCHSYSGPRLSHLETQKYKYDCKDERTPLKRISW